MLRFDDAIARLDGATRNGKGWTARCPAHDDNVPSLSVSESKLGKLLMHCHAGCSFDAICAALGGRAPNPPQTTKRANKPRQQKKTGTGHARLVDCINALAKVVGGEAVDKWRYDHADKSMSFWIVRFETPKGKQYRPIHRDSSDKLWYVGDPPGALPLYKLPELLECDGTVHVVEGEKCVEALRLLGLTATTSSYGAKAASKTDWTPLAGRMIKIFPDDDAPGRKYASEVYKILMDLVPTPSVSVIETPFALGGDVADFVKAARGEGYEDEAIRLTIEETTDDDFGERADTSELGLVVRCAAEIEPEPLSFLWTGRIPSGKVTLIVGDAKVGKTTVTLDIASRVSAGAPWSDQPDQPNSPGTVLLLSGEDDAADTIVPRLINAGANLDNVHIIEGVNRENESMSLFSLDRDLAILDEKLTQFGDVKLVVIDPIKAFMGRVDDHRDIEVRRVLAPLAVLAARHKVSVLVVIHPNKQSGAKALYRASGSMGYTAMARAVWGIGIDPKDPDRRIMVCIGTNLVRDPKALAFRLECKGDHPVVRWECEPVNVTADEVFGAGENPRRGHKRRSVADWLREQLANGPVESAVIRERARNEGLTQKTLVRAKDEIGVKSKKESRANGRWYWSLPTNEDSQIKVEDAQPIEMATFEGNGDLRGAKQAKTPSKRRRRPIHGVGHLLSK